VLVVGSHIFPDAFEWHIVDSLEQLRCPVEFFATESSRSGTPSALRRMMLKSRTLLLREPERSIESRLLRRVHAFAPSLILVTLGNQLSPKTVQRLRTVSRAPVVCWCQDQMTTIGRQFLLGAEYDAVFVKDRYLQDLFSRMIASTTFHYLPEACNPRVHRSVVAGGDRPAPTHDVMIAGTLYYYRQEILRQLSAFDLRIHGLRPDWLLNRLEPRHFDKPVFAHDKAWAIARSRICLNTLHYGEVDGLNGRAFEIAGCGGFQLITGVPVLGDHFEIGQEIVPFGTTAQLVELVRYYLDHPDRAADIARRGQERAYRDHTFEHRLRVIMKTVLGYEAVAYPDRRVTSDVTMTRTVA